jgi:hypothetical protein
LYHIALAASGALVAAAPALSAPGDEQLLRRHVPVLVLDSSEEWAPAALADAVASGSRLVDDDGRLIAAGDPREPGRTLTLRYLGERYPPPGPGGPGPRALEDDRIDIARGDPRPGGRRPPVYGRVVRERGRTWLQYWAFYLYNPQDRGILRIGRHEGDWELVQVELGRGERPTGATYAQHAFAERCVWSDVERRGGRPVVYVANASHASHFRPGVHKTRPFPDPVDEADGRGEVLRPQVEAFGGWARWPGRFGASGGGIVPGEQPSPRGPAFQEPWTDPAGFAAEARDCTATCGNRSGCRPLAVLAARNWPLALIVVAFGGLAVSRRRRWGRLFPFRH